MSPTHYNYRCTSCGLVESRYRNARACRRCGSGAIERLPEIVVPSSIELALQECQEELQRITHAAADLRTAFFAVCPESQRDDRFFEMMGDPAAVLGHVTRWLQDRAAPCAPAATEQPPLCEYCHTRHYGYQDHHLA